MRQISAGLCGDTASRHEYKQRYALIIKENAASTVYIVIDLFLLDHFALFVIFPSISEDLSRSRSILRY